MPNLETAQEWLTQSTLLLQAQPTTTRISTKYSLRNPTITKSTIRKIEKSKPRPKTSDEPATIPTTTATLSLKTYDPVSGTVLKYETDKAAEVGRLVMACSKLGRGMAGLEMKEEDDKDMLDAVAEGAEAQADGTATPTVVETRPTAGTGGGAGKKKKKGKK